MNSAIFGIPLSQRIQKLERLLALRPFGQRQGVETVELLAVCRAELLRRSPRASMVFTSSWASCRFRSPSAWRPALESSPSMESKSDAVPPERLSTAATASADRPCAASAVTSRIVALDFHGSGASPACSNAERSSPSPCTASPSTSVIQIRAAASAACRSARSKSPALFLTDR